MQNYYLHTLTHGALARKPWEIGKRSEILGTKHSRGRTSLSIQLSQQVSAGRWMVCNRCGLEQRKLHRLAEQMVQTSEFSGPQHLTTAGSAGTWHIVMIRNEALKQDKARLKRDTVSMYGNFRHWWVEQYSFISFLSQNCSLGLKPQRGKRGIGYKIPHVTFWPLNY